MLCLVCCCEAIRRFCWRFYTRTLSARCSGEPWRARPREQSETRVGSGTGEPPAGGIRQASAHQRLAAKTSVHIKRFGRIAAEYYSLLKSLVIIVTSSTRTCTRAVYLYTGIPYRCLYSTKHGMYTPYKLHFVRFNLFNNVQNTTPLAPNLNYVRVFSI